MTLIVFKLGDAVAFANTPELAQNLLLKVCSTAGPDGLEFGKPTEEELRITQCVLEQRGVPK